MNLPKRKLPRLAKYNYANEGYYFITICTHDRLHLFGDINNLNEIGVIAEKELTNIPTHFENVKIDKYVIMPNHIHCILSIINDSETEPAERSRPFPTSTIVGLYKSGVSKIVHAKYPDITLWQKSYHDHIIRGEADYQKIWQYIDENRLKWQEDEYYIAPN